VTSSAVEIGVGGYDIETRIIEALEGYGRQLQGRDTKLEALVCYSVYALLGPTQLIRLIRVGKLPRLSFIWFRNPGYSNQLTSVQILCKSRDDFRVSRPRPYQCLYRMTSKLQGTFAPVTELVGALVGDSPTGALRRLLNRLP
jgi:hypothetical protein